MKKYQAYIGHEHYFQYPGTISEFQYDMQTEEEEHTQDGKKGRIQTNTFHYVTFEQFDEGSL
jgi:hypothetical protein